MDQIVNVGEDAATFPEWLQKFGVHDFNTAPVGWREIHLQEYAQKAHSYSPQFIDFRQMLRLQDGTELKRMIQGTLWFYSDGTGLMVEFEYTKLVNGRYGFEPRYYAFGCAHIWGAALTPEEQARLIDQHDHGYKCQKCGYFEMVNSSD